MSQNALLRIQNLKVCAGEKEILHGIDLDIHENEVHVLMGPNGTGKSTLGAALMGNPEYTVTGGEILYKGQNINDMPDNERAKNGIFLSFQNPIEIPGITVSAFIRSALEAKTGKRVDNLLDEIKEVNIQHKRRITTGMLNDILNEATAKQQPPSDKGKRLKIYYATQASSAPPTFVLFVNDSDLFHYSYLRYIENQFRAAFGFEGTPIHFIIRERKKDK